MRIAVSVLAILFGLLHIIAAATQFKSEKPAARGFVIAMACGGINLICAVIPHLAGGRPGYVDAAVASVGCLLICASAYANGKRSGSLHPSHHIVRGAIATLLLVGIAVW